MEELKIELPKQKEQDFLRLFKELNNQPLQFQEDMLKQRTIALEIAGRLPNHTMAEVLQEADKAFEWVLSKRYITKI